MHITLTPVRSEATLALHRAGDVLSVNGAAFDLGPLAEGATLPRAAVGGDWLASDITRLDGALHLTLALPHGIDAAEAVRFPAPLDPGDGPVDLPGHAGGKAGDTPGQIDWGQVVRAEDRERDALSAARADAEARLTALLTAAAEAITGRPPLAEMLSWTAKEQAARAVLDKETDADITALVTREAAVTDEDPMILADKILRNAAGYRSAVATLTGLRRLAIREIAQARTPPEAEAALVQTAKALDRLVQHR